MTYEMGDESWLVSSSSKTNSTNTADCITNFCECERSTKVANRATIPIEVYVDLLLKSSSERDIVPLQLLRLAYVPRLSRNMISLKTVLWCAGMYSGIPYIITFTKKARRTISALCHGGTLAHMYAYHDDESSDDTAYVTITPGVKPIVLVNINGIDVSHGHAHEKFLCEKAKQLGITVGETCCHATGARWRRYPASLFSFPGQIKQLRNGGSYSYTCLDLRV